MNCTKLPTDYLTEQDKYTIRTSSAIMFMPIELRQKFLDSAWSTNLNEHLLFNQAMNYFLEPRKKHSGIFLRLDDRAMQSVLDYIVPKVESIVGLKKV